jgi:SPP1 family predicted phage head-tail adaptor
MKKYSLARLNKKIIFGKDGMTVVNGVPVSGFQKVATVWCGDYRMSIESKMNLEGVGAYKDTMRLIVIRHNELINQTMMAKLDGVTYKIDNIDSEKGINTFDVVTLEVKA